MKRSPTIIAALAAMLAFNSCQQEYICDCVYRPGVMQIANTPRHHIKARNEAAAAEKCEAKETEIMECSLQ